MHRVARRARGQGGKGALLTKQTLPSMLPTHVEWLARRSNRWVSCSLPCLCSCRKSNSPMPACLKSILSAGQTLLGRTGLVLVCLSITRMCAAIRLTSSGAEPVGLVHWPRNCGFTRWTGLNHTMHSVFCSPGESPQLHSVLKMINQEKELLQMTENFKTFDE